jgi:hypothetical protein
MSLILKILKLEYPEVYEDILNIRKEYRTMSNKEHLERYFNDPTNRLYCKLCKRSFFKCQIKRHMNSNKHIVETHKHRKEEEEESDLEWDSD